jgi:hypothetical protein
VAGVARGKVAVFGFAVALAACYSGTKTLEAVSFHGAKLARVHEGIYIDPAAPLEARATLVGTYAHAEARTAAFYGELRSERPLTVFCATDECRFYFTGPARRSWTLGPGHTAPGAPFTAVEQQTVIVDYLDDRTMGTLAHELSHVEMGFRIRRGRVPAWFNEGVAVFVGSEPNCSRPLPNAVDDLRTLESREAWLTQTSRPKPALVRTYCQAEREVAAWIGKNGRARLLDLLDDVHRGASFDDEYGPLLTP